jgi:hypothetical protein
MLWAVTERAEVLNVAVVPLSGWVARIVAPSLNCTEPLGVPAPGAVALTVAVKVTDCPKTDGFAEEPTAVVVFALLTVWVRGGDVLPVKLPPPL